MSSKRAVKTQRFDGQRLRPPRSWNWELSCLLALIFWCFSSFLATAQRNLERPPSLDPILAEREARELVADMVAQKPGPGPTNGLLKIRDSEGHQREVPVRFETSLTPTNWVHVYETLPSSEQPAGVKLTIIHADGAPNEYFLTKSGEQTGTAAAKPLAEEQIMAPFAGSDFWIADLGFEFLHWPKQHLLKKEMKNSRSCDVLESINPKPSPRGYSRIVSWITIETPHEPVQASAYDAHGELLKQFEPKAVERVQGHYQIESVEMRNRKTHSRTVMEFALEPK